MLPDGSAAAGCAEASTSTPARGRVCVDGARATADACPGGGVRRRRATASPWCRPGARRRPPDDARGVRPERAGPLSQSQTGGSSTGSGSTRRPVPVGVRQRPRAGAPAAPPELSSFDRDPTTSSTCAPSSRAPRPQTLATALSTTRWSAVSVPRAAAPRARSARALDGVLAAVAHVRRHPAMRPQVRGVLAQPLDRHGPAPGAAPAARRRGPHVAAVTSRPYRPGA